MVDAGFSVQVLLAAVAGGALGASLGALPSLSLAGFVIVIGEAAEIVARTLGESTFGNPEAAAALQLTEAVGLGPALGPHVAFAGGVAAAAYAGRHGRTDDAFPYHPAKAIRRPLASTPDVLLAGAVFGLIGVLVARLAFGLSLPVDPVALAIVVSGFGHRLAFGYPLVGTIDGSVLDMSPFDPGDGRGGLGSDGAGGKSAASTGGPGVEPWQPHHYEWATVTGLGIAVGLVAGYVGLVTESGLLAFGLALASLLFLAVGVDRFPVTHHMALPAGVAAVGLAGTDVRLAIVVAAVFGLLGGLLGELAQRGLYAHADTHLDPSFVSILLTSLLLAALAAAGLLDASAVSYAAL